MLARPPLRSIGRGEGDLRRKAGERSSSSIPTGSPQSTSSWFRRSPQVTVRPSNSSTRPQTNSWVGVTPSPTADWIARQVSEACGWEPVPDYLVHDRDRVYGEAFTRRIRAMGIRDRPTAPRSPWQNGYSERLIGSIRRECLDHVIIICERHLRHILRSYQQYYNDTRTHLSLAKDSPDEIRPGGRSHSSAAGPPADCTIITSGSDFRQG
jgi:hypothetical protein